jgi:hypothetical protein
MVGAMPGVSAQTYVEAIGDFANGAANAAESGIAISNTGPAPESVNLAFTILNGAPSTVST